MMKTADFKKRSIILIQGYFHSEFFSMLKKKRIKDVFVLEGRPDLETSKHSVKELNKRGISPTMISDNMAGFLFYKDLVKETWVSYQLKDKNGAVCQIGGLILGVLGKRHNVPVCLYSAKEKTALMGKEKEIFYFKGTRTAPRSIRGYVPKIEWLPRKYISGVMA